MDRTGVYARRYVFFALVLLLQGLFANGSNTEDSDTTECTVSSDCPKGRFCAEFSNGRNVTLCLPHQQEYDLCDPNTECMCAADLSCQLFVKQETHQKKPAFPVYRCQPTSEPTPVECQHNSTEDTTTEVGSGTANLRDILTENGADMEMSGSGFEMTRDQFLEQLKELLLARSYKGKKVTKGKTNKGKKHFANH